MKKYIFALLASVFISALFFTVASAEDLPYDKPVGTVYMQYGAPVIDGSITDSEGWGKV
ncbi:MAG: hypothetical protein IJT91_00055 [Clostridia bacterium]|nr:hypothetical protein [Clostridia bacterium]